VSMDTRDVTVSVEDNELLGRESLKKKFPKFDGILIKSMIYKEGV